jgi:2-polyprenyl-6-methoxyphenol hydroxylase-like FAD-dependent oxidoreductase
LRPAAGWCKVRARYVLAADGANSTVRQRLGIGTAHGGFGPIYPCLLARLPTRRLHPRTNLTRPA